jgi:hypothetical protein
MMACTMERMGYLWDRVPDRLAHRIVKPLALIVFAG